MDNKSENALSETEGPLTKSPANPNHPLVDQQPADTLAHVQVLLTFAQEYAAKAAETPELTPYEIRTYEGLYALLKTANSALDYEIERLGFVDLVERVVKKNN